MKRIFIYIYFFVTVILLFISCREDIIAPDNFATNVNEPILINESNSYSFVINAQNISINVINNTNFSANTSRISITIVDYSSGYVRVRIIDNQSNTRFSYFGNDDEDFFTQSLNGYVPASVGIKAVDFSGKLKIQLNRTF
ncbi:MAG: hypothetical protein IH852_10155 [Bacteroidetes bacterium]|nr:hypothetical protein [Bacteroidota bacterium]